MYEVALSILKGREIDDATLACSQVHGIVSIQKAVQDKQADVALGAKVLETIKAKKTGLTPRLLNWIGGLQRFGGQHTFTSNFPLPLQAAAC